MRKSIHPWSWLLGGVCSLAAFLPLPAHAIFGSCTSVECVSPRQFETDTLPDAGAALERIANSEIPPAAVQNSVTSLSLSLQALNRTGYAPVSDDASVLPYAEEAPLLPGFFQTTPEVFAALPEYSGVGPLPGAVTTELGNKRLLDGTAPLAPIPTAMFETKTYFPYLDPTKLTSSRAGKLD